MPKAMLFTTDFPPAKGGGILTHAKFMADSLQALGWEFIVMSEYYLNASEDEISAYSEQSGHIIYKLPESPSVRSLLKKARYCSKICKQHQPDLIIGSGRHPTWFAAYVSKRRGIPLVTIGHGTEFTQSTSTYDFKINKWSYSRSSLMIAISEFTKKTAQEMGLNPKRFEVIPNPSDPAAFYPLESSKIEEFKAKNGIMTRSIILTVGSLSERKGQRVVINALPEIVAEIPNVLYVAVGPPAKREEYLQLAGELGVSDHVLFPGIIEESELLKWYNACDLFAMTSVNFSGDYEGYGIAVVEAALCGKTAVVSDNGGLKEAVLNEKTGFVVPEGNHSQLANTIIAVLSDPHLREKMNKNAQNHVLDNNTYEVIGVKYDTVLRTILAKKR